VLQKLWRALTAVLLIAAAVASVTAMVTVMSQHLGFAPVLSPSMEPTFHPGDLVVTKPEPASAVKVGQVIALPVPSAPSQRYVHRVISVTTKDGKPLVRTKGDANPAPEPFSLRIDSPTVPVVVATVPELGHVSVLLQRPNLRITVMVITVIAMLLAAWRMLARPVLRGGKRRA
jgi:signal peptidase I